MAKKMTPGNMYRGYRNPFMGGYGGYGSRQRWVNTWVC